MALLEPIRTAKIPSIPSSASEVKNRKYDKCFHFKSREGSDPLRVLEPERKKLTSLESQRVIAVLDDSIRRIEISATLPFVVENLQRFSILLGAELSHLLQEHDMLQSRYQKAVSQLHLDEKRLVGLRDRLAEQKEKTETEFFFDDGKRSVADDLTSLDVTLAERKLITDEKEVNFLQNHLKDSLKNLLRLFDKNPTAFDALRQEGKQRSEQANEILKQLQALKAIIFEKLLRTPSEVKERNSYVIMVTGQENKYSKHAEKLLDELNIATEDKDNELSIRNEVIRKLKFEIFHMEKTSREHNQQVLSEAQKEQLAEEKSSEGKRAKIMQDIIEQKKLMENLISKHRASELAFRQKKYKVETEVENWIQKYDMDMGERQDEFEQLDKVYTIERKQLNELEERFRTMEREYQEIMEARRIAREKAEKAHRELQTKMKAATLIQSFWRAFKAKKQLKTKKKKKRKKKNRK